MTPDAHDLAVLDDRMQAAAGRLHTAVAARLAEAPVVSEPRPRRVRRGGLRVTVPAVGVAAGFLIGCLAAVVVTRDEGELTEAGQPVDLAAPHDWLLPTWLPGEDYELTGAQLSPPATEPQVTGTIVAYGNGWTGPRLTVAEGRLGPGTADAAAYEPITIAGHPAGITGESGGRVEIRWGEGSDETQVLGEGLTRQQVEDAAAHVEDGPSIGADGLPDGFEELGRGPVSYWGNALGTQELGGLSLNYGLDDAQPPFSSTIQLTQRSGSQEELDLFPLRCPTPVEFQLFGAPAYDCDGDQISFYDPGSHQIVEIHGMRFEDTARTFAEGLRPASQAEVEELVAPFEPPPLPQPAPGEISLHTDITDGEVWRLLAVEDTSDSYDIAVQTQQGRVTQHLDVDGGWRDIYLNLADGGGGRTGDHLVFGTVPEATHELVVEYTNLAPQPVDLVSINGWPVAIYATHLQGDGAGATLVARDAAGNELARLGPDVYLAGVNSTVPGPMGTTEDPETSGCPATRTFDDGETVCLM